jgi:hypothetical protein
VHSALSHHTLQRTCKQWATLSGSPAMDALPMPSLLCTHPQPCSEKLVKAFNDQAQRQYVFLLSSKAGGWVGAPSMHDPCSSPVSSAEKNSGSSRCQEMLFATHAQVWAQLSRRQQAAAV